MLQTQKLVKKNTRNIKRKQETILARNVSHRSTSVSLRRKQNQQAPEEYVQ
jgi:hypothetical protein